eukprot:885233_1
MHKRPIIRFLFISAISGMPLYDLLRGACFQRATRRFLLSFLGECMRQILHLRLRISFVGCFADVIEYIFECLFLTQFQFERIPQKPKQNASKVNQFRRVLTRYHPRFTRKIESVSDL